MPGAGCAIGPSGGEGEGRERERRGKGEGYGSGPWLSLCFGHYSLALPLSSSAHAGGQSHSPPPFDLGKERLIWESRQGDAHLPKLLDLWIWDEGIVFSNLF